MTTGEQFWTVNVKVDVRWLNVVEVERGTVDDGAVKLTVQLQFVGLDATRQSQQLTSYVLICSA